MAVYVDSNGRMDRCSHAIERPQVFDKLIHVPCVQELLRTICYPARYPRRSNILSDSLKSLK